MHPPIKIKVCGITREADIELALSLGIDWLGINLYEPSPRSVALPQAMRLLKNIPAGKRVCVTVMPTLRQLQSFLNAGFDFIQVHCDFETPAHKVAEWSQTVSPSRLWLAPKLPPDHPFPEPLLPYADTFLVDTFSRHAYGGTGATGNWQQFAQLRQHNSKKNWILAGGLNPDNIEAAIRQSTTHIVDVNSGVETSPGIKDAAKLRKLCGLL